MRQRSTKEERYKRLAPVWDETQRVFRVGERVRLNVPFTWDHQLPILLPRDHPFTILAMWEAHNEGHTGAVGGTLVRFRRRYWTPQGGKLAKRIKGSCVICANLTRNCFHKRWVPFQQPFWLHPRHSPILD